MCCYLYAAFSLKGEADGLAPDEARGVAGWKRQIITVALDEMTHLALVANLMSSLGATPHFGRPNLPISPGYHPAGVVVALALRAPGARPLHLPRAPRGRGSPGRRRLRAAFPLPAQHPAGPPDVDVAGLLDRRAPLPRHSQRARVALRPARRARALPRQPLLSGRADLVALPGISEVRD